MELKAYIVIKQVDKKHQLKEDYMVIGEDLKSVKIHDPYGGNAGFQRIPEQKPGAEFHFKCDKVIECGAANSVPLIFKESCDDMITNALTNAKNGMIITYGQSKSGKSTALYGNAKTRHPGLMQTSVNRFFESHTPSSSHQKSNGVQGLYLSIFDINLESIRDFGKYFYNQQTQTTQKDFDFTKITADSLEKEAAELLDNSNDVIQVRALSKIEVKNPDSFSKIMVEEEEFRTQLDQRHKINNKKYHTVYVLTIKHKMSATPTYLFFVKIAGSEKSMKGSADQKRVQEQIIANNQLFSLAKYLGGLSKNDSNVSYHESKLTKSLHGILQNEEKECQVSFLAHIYPVEQNYEESLLTLQYLDRLKAYDQTYKKVIFDGPMPEQVQAQERLMERIIIENQDLKKKYDSLIMDERERFDEIKRRLGLEFTVNQILKAKPNTKEFQYLLLHQEAEQRSDTLSNTNSELNRKLKNMIRKQEDSATSLQQFQQRCEQQISLLESKYEDLEYRHNGTKNQIRSKVQEEMKDINDEISKMMLHGQILIEEKAHLIHGLKDELKKTSEHFNKFSELKEMGKREAEMQYKQIVIERQKEYEESKVNIEEQYTHLIQQKGQELKKFLDEATKYTHDKKEEMRSSRMELVELFEIVKKQNTTIDQVESGVFSGGIKSYNIPKSDKQLFPDRETFPLQGKMPNYYSLYKSLEKTKTLATVQNGKVFQQYAQQQSMRQTQQKFEDTYIKDMEQNLLQQKGGLKGSIAKRPNYQDYDSTQENYDFEGFRKVKTQEVDVLTLDQLKSFAKALQQEIKRCKNTVPLNPNGIREQTLDNMIKEREKWKQATVQEQRKIADAQEVLESQKRLIDKQDGTMRNTKSQGNLNILTLKDTIHKMLKIL